MLECTTFSRKMSEGFTGVIVIMPIFLCQHNAKLWQRQFLYKYNKRPKSSTIHTHTHTRAGTNADFYIRTFGHQNE